MDSITWTGRVEETQRKQGTPKIAKTEKRYLRKPQHNIRTTTRLSTALSTEYKSGFLTTVPRFCLRQCLCQYNSFLRIDP
jgi:hypothetical protein